MLFGKWRPAKAIVKVELDSGVVLQVFTFATTAM
jgi:hypothetical protein